METPDTAQSFSESVLQVAIAQLAQNVGWHSIGSSSFDVLVDVCIRFIREIGKCSAQAAAHRGNQLVDWNDIQMSFDWMGISLQELDDYCSHVAPIPFASGALPKYPVQLRPALRVNYPDETEINTRPDHLEPWLPSIRFKNENESTESNDKGEQSNDLFGNDFNSNGQAMDEEALDKRYIGSLKAQFGDLPIGGFTELNALVPNYIYISTQGQVLSYGGKEGKTAETGCPPLWPEDLKRIEEEERKREEVLQKEREAANHQPIRLKINKDKKLKKFGKDGKEIRSSLAMKKFKKEKQKDKLMGASSFNKLSIKMNKSKNEFDSDLDVEDDDDDYREDFDNDRFNRSLDRPDEIEDDDFDLDLSSNKKRSLSMQSDDKFSELDKSNESGLSFSKNDKSDSGNLSAPRPVGRPKGSGKKQKSAEELEKERRRRERQARKEEMIMKKIRLREERKRKREERERMKQEKRNLREKRRMEKLKQKSEKSPRRGRPRKVDLLQRAATTNPNNSANDAGNLDRSEVSLDSSQMNTSVRSMDDSKPNDEHEAASILMSLSEENANTQDAPTSKKKTKTSKLDDKSDDESDLSDDFSEKEEGERTTTTESESEHSDDFSNDIGDSMQSTPRFKSLAELKAMPEVDREALKKKRQKQLEDELNNSLGKRGKEKKSKKFVDDIVESDSSSENEPEPIKPKTKIDEDRAPKKTKSVNTNPRPLSSLSGTEAIPSVVKEEPVAPIIVKRTEPTVVPVEIKSKPPVKVEEAREVKEIVKEKKKKRKRIEIDAHELIEQALFPKLTVKLGSGASQTCSPIPILKSHISPPSSPKVKRKELDHKDHEKEKEKEKEKEREKWKKDKENPLKIVKKEDKKEAKKVDESIKVKDEEAPKKLKKKAKVIITPTRAARKEMADKNCTLITQTVSTVESDDKIWICPSCSKPDDGSPMIGCDNCDEWHHWACVGINEPPTDDESWFCKICISKQQQIESKFKKRKIKKTDFEPSHSSDRPRVPSVKEELNHDCDPKPSISIKVDKPIVNEEGEWICPACQRPDDGSPMIGCDQCDQWFHWICVGITVEPSDQDKWFCRRCKKHSDSSGKKKKHKK